MSCFTDFSLISLGIALLVVCGCDQPQVDKGRPGESKNMANAGIAEAKKPTIKKADAVEPAGQTEAVKRTSSPTVVERTKTVETSHVIPQENKSVSEDPVSSDPGDAPVSKNQQPATVADVVAALNFSQFPQPEDAENAFVFQTSLHYETSADLDTALVSVSDELLKRGFTAGDSIRTRMATVTVKIDDRPMTIFLSNSMADKMTHVTMHHHQGVDVSAIPRLQTNGPVDQRVDQVYYTSPIGVREGQQILRADVSEKNIPIARMMNSNGIAQIFEKGGLKFVCQVEEVETMEFEYPTEGESKKTRIFLSSQGNVDVANLPRPDDFKKPVQAYNAIFGAVKYYTTAKAADAVKRGAQDLQNAGWKPVESMRETISDRQKLLINNGALIRVEATEYGDERTHVQYYLSMLSFDFPKDIDTRLIRVDTASPKMLFTTSADVEQITKFYTEHLPAIGWKPNKSRRLAETDQYRQLFEGNYFQPVLLHIQNKGPQTTWVELRPIDFDAVAGVFETDDQQEIEAPVETDAAKTDQVADITSAMENVVVPDTPEKIEELARTQIEAALKNVPAEQAAEIRKLMESSLQSTMNEALDVPTTGDEQHAVADSLSSETDDSDDDPTGDENSNNVVPAGKIAADDFPIPEGAKNVSRDFEMITFSTDEIKKNAKSISDKLAELDWKPRGEQMIETDMAYLNFQKGTGTINVSLILDDRKDPPVHAVIQGDGIWFADSNEFAGENAEFEGDMETEGEMEFEGDMEGFDSSDAGFDHLPTEFEGLPLPKGIDSPVKSGSQFRSELTTSVESDLKSVYEFFRTSATDSNWKTKSEVLNENQNATLTLTNDQGEMLVELRKYEGEIEINLALRNPKLAKENGFLPPAGKARLMLANISKVETIIVINDKTYKLAPEQGAENPKDCITADVKPGTYNYTIKGSGREQQSGKLKVVADGSWGVVVFPEQGHMAERMY